MKTLFSVTPGLILRSLLRKELFQDLLESVIPECLSGIQARSELDPRLRHSGVTHLG
jgi:hypothetical protein